MANLNKSICPTAGNTGTIECGLNPKKPIAIFLTYSGKKFADADLAPASLQATLQAAIAATGKARIFPIMPFVQFDDKSEEAKIATHGFGNKEFVSDGKNHYQFRIEGGSVCMQKQLRKFNGRSNLRALIVYEGNIVFGTVLSDGSLAGQSLSSFAANPVKISNGTDPSIYTIDLMFSDPTEGADAPGFVKADFNILEACKGIVDVTLTAGTLASGSIKVTAAKTCGQTSMYDDYADLLADPDAWDLTKAGAPVSITGVAKDAAIKGWTVTFTGTGEHVLTMAPADELATLGIGGSPDVMYESDALTVTVPA